MTDPSEIVAVRDRIAQQADDWPRQASALVIADNDTYKQAGFMLKGIKALSREADDLFDPVIEDANRAHKSALAAKRTVTDPLKTAEAILKRGMGEYTSELERKRLAEETRLRELAEKQASEERRARLAEAAKEGPQKLAEAVTAPQAPPAAVTVAKTAPKVEGISTRMVWKSEIVDLDAFLRFALERPKGVNTFLDMVSVDLPRLTALGRDTDGAITVPGVRFYQEPVVSSR